MRSRTLPHFLFVITVTCLLWSGMLIPAQAAPPAGWSGDDNLAFLVEVNGVNAVGIDAAHPLPLNLSVPVELSLTISTGTNLTIHSGVFSMTYMGMPIVNQPFDLSSFGEIPENTTASVLNASLPLGSALSYGGLPLIAGTIIGLFSFTYSNSTTPLVNVTVSEDFVLQVGGTGLAAVMSISGLITAGFTAMSIFSLILSLDEFQRGIFAARKMRGAKRGSDVGVFPTAAVLRRKPKKGGETIDRDELIRRVSEAAKNGWDQKRCPKCGKKWKKGSPTCTKCGIDVPAAVEYFSSDIADYAPKALKVVKPKSKVTVGQFGKKLKLKPDKAGALAAALVDMGIFQTKTVKVPLKKVAFSGMTLAGTYWSWMQLVGGASPDWVTVLLTTSAGLIVSVLIGYFMYFLARVPELGYE
ncbi:MAG: zinc ribbon domain-containing protein [Candidatus Thorarchaeota archaeon]